MPGWVGGPPPFLLWKKAEDGINTAKIVEDRDRNDRELCLGPTHEEVVRSGSSGGKIL
jgi:hypothetical protein